MISLLETEMDAKKCGVCGDKSLGYNFNAVTCESCKAFFRRNALVDKPFKCPFNENCDITVVTRRFCQRCRLVKCLAIGMRKDYIMSEADKVLKRQKVNDNKVKKSLTKYGCKKVKRETSSNDSDDDTSANLDTNCRKCATIDLNSSGNQSDSSLNSYVNEDLQSPDHYDDTHLAIHNIFISTSNGSTSNEEDPCSPAFNNNIQQCNNNHLDSHLNITADVSNEILQDIERIPIEVDSMESILCEAIKLEFNAYPSMSQNKSTSRDLNDAERAKLNELIVANKALSTPLDDDLHSLIVEDCRFQSNPEQALQSDPALVDVINLTAIAIRRLIKMSKKINAFKNLCQEDQVALLKRGCTEMMILRSAMNYDPTKQTWKIPHSQESKSTLKVDVLKLAKGNIYHEHERFIKTFDPKWRADENIVLILSAITLFTPDRPRVVHQDVIKLEQNSYYYLLRRYLESVYAGCEAKSIFLKLIQKISELHKLNSEVINVYLNVNPSEIEPLLIELFDLKH